MLTFSVWPEKDRNIPCFRWTLSYMEFQTWVILPGHVWAYMLRKLYFPFICHMVSRFEMHLPNKFLNLLYFNCLHMDMYEYLFSFCLIIGFVVRLAFCTLGYWPSSANWCFAELPPAILNSSHNNELSHGKYKSYP